MHRRHIVILMAAVLAAAGFTAAPAAGPRSPETKASVEVAGVRIAAEPYGGSERMRPFNAPPGTMLVLQVTHSEGGFYGMDSEGSSLQKARDETGKNLLKGDSEVFRTGFQDDVRTSADGRVALVRAFAPGTPTRKARSIHLKGTIRLLRADGTRTVTRGDVTAEDGASFRLAGSTFTVAGTERSFGQVEMELETDIDPTRVAGMALVGPRGEEVTGSTFEKEDGRIRLSLKPGSGREDLTVRLELRTGVETVTVPLDRTVSVGF